MNKHNIFLLLTIVAFLQGCVSNKTLTYFEELSPISLSETDSVYHLAPHDLLFIDISSSSQEVNKYFGISDNQGNMALQNLDISPAAYVNGFSVNSKGYIILPIVGPVSVVEKTVEEATVIVYDKLNSFFKTNVQVVLKLANYSFTILGEVNNQGRYYVNEDEINLIEAIGKGGGINTYGNVKEVQIIRKHKGESRKIVFDLNKANAANYIIYPDDIIYIKPLAKGGQKQNPNPMIAIIISGVSSIFLFLSIILN